MAVVIQYTNDQWRGLMDQPSPKSYSGKVWRVADLRPEITDWLNEHGAYVEYASRMADSALGSLEVRHYFLKIEFKNLDDAMLFKLTWL